MSAESKKSDKGDQAFNIGCGAVVLIVIFALGIYFDSLIVQILGVLILCAALLGLIADKTHSDIIENFAIVPMCCAVLVFIYIAIFASRVKVTEDGDHYHYYKKCPAIAGKEYEEMMKADAFLLGNFHECKLCKKHKAEKKRELERQYEEEGTDYIPGVPSRYQ